MDELYVNYGQMDITPEEEVLLAGYANRKGMSAGLHRPLTTRCVALRTDGHNVCLITNDLVDIVPEITTEMIHRIARETAIPEGNVFVHAIHTHSAPVMERGASEANDRYIDWAIDRIEQNAVRTAADSTAYQRCGIRLGSSRCDISANRRLIDPQTGLAMKVSNTQGANDQEVSILQMANRAGKPVVTLFNYACHPVILGYESVVVSTDYPGAAREIVEQSFGGKAVFLNGAAGNINPCLTDQVDPAVADQEGRKLGSAVVNSEMVGWDGPMALKVKNRTVGLPYRDQHMTAERFRREVQRRLGDQTEFHNWQQDLKKWGDLMIDRLEKGTVPDVCSIEMSAVRFGPAALLLSQGEVFNEYQIRVKQHFPALKVFFVAYTNGARGYIPTEESFRHKGYEVDQAYVYSEEPSPLTPEVERLFLNAVDDLLRESL
jgi:neutral ceramidase